MVIRRVILLFLFIFLFLFNEIQAQDYWSKADKEILLLQPFQPREDWHYLSLDNDKLNASLITKNISTSKAQENNISIELPNEKGIEETFSLTPVAVLSPELARQFPRIKTYVGRSKIRPDVSVRISYTPIGINAWIRFPDGKNRFIQPIGNNRSYLSYLRSDTNTINSFECTTPLDHNWNIEEKLKRRGSSFRTSDSHLKTFRLAISTSGGYTSFWGDNDPSNGSNKEDAFAAVVSTINRVNEIFENELGIHLELVNGLDLIYDDPDNDPYTDDFGSEVQETLDEVLGSQNYDIGHLFAYSTASGGGNAGSVGNVCIDNKKGSAYSYHPFEGSFNDPFLSDHFDIDYVAHEMAHQFGAFHTFGYENEFEGVSSEPGSGSTIMGYAGITGSDNVQKHSDPYFHYHSLKNINDYVQNQTCYTSSLIENNPPTVNAGADYTIPIGTPYELKATASDPDNLKLYYCWEQLDSGEVGTNNFGPNFHLGSQARSLPPTESAIRTIPRMEAVLDGKLTETNPSIGSNWETVSNIERTLTWGVTVRDYFPALANGNGKTTSDARILKVTSKAGPFKILSQAEEGIFWEGGSRQMVSWDVSNTDQNPINTTNVSILMSKDLGQTFNKILVANTPNDGNEEITVPTDINSDQVRIKIIPDNSIYFTVNTQNIEIQQSPFTLLFNKYNQEICEESEIIFDYSYATYLGFNEEVNLSISNLPPGVEAIFSSPKLIQGSSSGTLRLLGLQNLSYQDLMLEVFALGSTISKTVELELKALNGNFSNIELLSPTVGEQGISRNVTLTWEVETIATSYILEVAKDVNFSNIILSTSTIANSYFLKNLDFAEEYFWRVKPLNICGTGAFSESRVINTTLVNCKNYYPSSLPRQISDSQGVFPGITKVTINVFDQALIEDINVKISIEHLYIEDISIYLIAPNQNKIKLSQNLGENFDNYINTVFDQESSNSIVFGLPPFTGSFSPIEDLSDLYGNEMTGEWIIQIEDNFEGTSGNLTDAELQICYSGEIILDTDNDSIADFKDNCPTIANNDQSDIDRDGLGDLCDLNTPNNFLLTKSNPTCALKNNGIISINGKAHFSYKADIKGPNGYFSQKIFNHLYNATINNLSPGNYSICITSDEDINFESYFNTLLESPDPLNVLTELNYKNQSLTVDLSGATYYEILLNNSRYEFNSGRHELNLKEGLNRLEITTNQDCQGKVEENIYLSEVSTIYPNPAFNSVNVLLGGQANDFIISIFSIDGDLIEQFKEQHLPNNRTFTIPLDYYPQGVYLINVICGDKIENIKLLKR